MNFKYSFTKHFNAGQVMANIWQVVTVIRLVTRETSNLKNISLFSGECFSYHEI